MLLFLRMSCVITTVCGVISVYYAFTHNKHHTACFCQRSRGKDDIFYIHTNVGDTKPRRGENPAVSPPCRPFATINKHSLVDTFSSSGRVGAYFLSPWRFFFAEVRSGEHGPDLGRERYCGRRPRLREARHRRRRIHARSAHLLQRRPHHRLGKKATQRVRISFACRQTNRGRDPAHRCTVGNSEVHEDRWGAGVDQYLTGWG